MTAITTTERGERGVKLGIFKLTFDKMKIDMYGNCLGHNM
jgi:hypothetical protein